MPFKFVILFQSLCHFKSIPALYHLHVVIASPLHSHHSVQLLFHSTSLSNYSHHIHSNLSTKSMRFRSVLCNFPSPFCLLHTTFISTPFSHFHFPRCFSLSTPLTTQIKSLPPSHKIVAHFIPVIIPATFIQNVIRFPTSTPFQLAFTPHSLIDFRHHFLISTLIIYCY